MLWKIPGAKYLWPRSLKKLMQMQVDTSWQRKLTLDISYFDWRVESKDWDSNTFLGTGAMIL